MAVSLQGLAAVPPTTYIQGSVDAKNLRTMYLYRVDDGNMEQYASVKVSPEGTFAFAVANPEEGFYYVSTSTNTNSSIPHRIYVKGAATIEMDIKGQKAVVKGGTKENQQLAKWQEVYDDIAIPSWSGVQYRGTYEDFFPIFDSFIPKYEAFRKTLKTTGNKSFDAYMQFLMENDVDAAAVNFLFMPRSKHPEKSQYPAYYNQIMQGNKYSNTQILRLGDGVRRMSAYLLYGSLQKGKAAANEPMVDNLQNDTLKGIFLVNGLGRYRDQQALIDGMAPYQHLLVTDSLKARYARAVASLATFSKGTKAFSFSYPDINGKAVSLESLKGKVVLVDMWATWCGPCKQEIPHLKKLEEELHGTDIQVVSISVDKDADKQKWEDFVKKENLTGLQLFAGSKGDMMDYYKISGIPRFLVFDKQGKIVSVDSPRPSNPELKKLLLATAAAK